jgi:hypothetical protein
MTELHELVALLAQRIAAGDLATAALLVDALQCVSLEPFRLYLLAKPEADLIDALREARGIAEAACVVGSIQ